MPLKVLINELSGSVKAYGEYALRQKCCESFEISEDVVQFLHPEAFKEQLEAVNENDRVLIGGGDGTILQAASILAPKNIAFGVIPLGTMNMFAQDLGLTDNALDVIGRYQQAKEVQIDAASVNGELFLCSAMVGIPTEVAQTRENERNKETPLTWMRVAKEAWEELSDGGARIMQLTHGDKSEKKDIKAAVISNNEYDAHAGFGTFKKKSLTDGKLSVYTLNPDGPFESMMLMAQLAIGAWEDAAGLAYFNASSLKLDAEEGEERVLLDGEIRYLQRPLMFQSEPKKLKVILPDG